MANIEVRKTRSGSDRFRVKVRKRGYACVSRTFKTLREAEVFGKDIEQGIDEQRAQDISDWTRKKRKKQE